MSRALRLRVWTPAETVIDVEDVQWVHVDLNQSRPVTIWPGHAPLLAETSAGELSYADQEATHTLTLAPGVLQVQENEVVVLIAGTLQAEGADDGQSFERLTRTSLAALDPSR